MAASLRDWRVDFWRGIALSMVLIDHIESLAGVPRLSRWTLQALGPSDAAELFVLLSGLVVGRAYLRRIEQGSLWLAQRHALRRAWVVYLAMIVVSLMVTALVRLSPAGAFPRDSLEPLRETGLLTLAVQFFSFRLVVFGFHFFPLYITFLVIAPLAVYVLRRYRALGLIPSLVAYIAVQGGGGDSAIQHSGFWTFNLVAWQLPFVLGLAAGVLSDRGRFDAPPVTVATRRRIVMAACFAILVWGWWMTRQPAVYSFAGLFAKSTLGPARLIHGLAVVGFLFAAIPAGSQVQRSRACRLFIVCGRNSLWTYSCGVLLTYSAALLLSSLEDAAAVLIVEFDALAMMCGLAWLFDRRVSAGPPPRLDASEMQTAG